MHLSNRARNAWRCNDVSHAPARDAECLRHPIHDDRALAHPVQGDRRDMFGVVVDNVLVNLICDGKDIPFLHSSPTNSSSSQLNSLPVGLFGVLIIIALVLLLKAA